MQIVCDFCEKFKQDIVSCEKCNVDICTTCSKDKTLNIKKIIPQKRMEGLWHGKPEQGETQDHIELLMVLEENGEVVGTGKGLKNEFLVTGYHYLSYIAIVCAPFDD